MKKTIKVLLLFLLFAGWSLAVAGVVDNLWQDNGDGSISPRSGKSVTMPTTYLIDGTDTHTIKAVQETGLGGRLTFGLDETARAMVICDAGDVDVDFGLSARGSPAIFVENAAANDYSVLTATSISLSSGSYAYSFDSSRHLLIGGQGFTFQSTADAPSGDMAKFLSSADRELTDTDGEQSWLYVEPKINQSGTAGYNGLKIKVTETALGTGATAAGGTNNLIVAGTSVDEDMFKVDNTGRIVVAETTDPAALADHAFFYAKDVGGTGEAFAADAAATAAQLTAHNDTLFTPDPAEKFPWMPYFSNSAIGLEVGYDMSRALRDLEALTGKKYIHERDLAQTFDLAAKQKADWIAKYIGSNTVDAEIPAADALETYQADVPVFREEIDAKTGKTIKRATILSTKTVGYELTDSGEVKAKTENVLETKTVEKKRLKAGCRFDEQTGKFYRTTAPTLAQAQAAADAQFVFRAPKWLTDRLSAK